MKDAAEPAGAFRLGRPPSRFPAPSVGRGGGGHARDAVSSLSPAGVARPAQGAVPWAARHVDGRRRAPRGHGR